MPSSSVLPARSRLTKPSNGLIVRWRRPKVKSVRTSAAVLWGVTSMRPQVVRQKAGKMVGPRLWRWLAGVAVAALCPCARGTEPPAAELFRRDVQPILKRLCYDCHGDGAKEGNVAFDELAPGESLLNHDLWFKVLKNTRAGIMPKEQKRLPPSEQQALDKWILFTAFGADPHNLDP